MALNKDMVIEEALKLLNEVGVDGVSLRAVANRLGVKPPTLYWHIKNKAALTNEMADRILQPVIRNLQQRKIDESWQDWLVIVFNQLRQAMLAYADGARVVAGSHFSITMSDLMEVTIKTLLTAGVSLRASRLIALTATHFTIGHVIEAQTALDETLHQGFNMDVFAKDHPTMIAGIEEYFNSGRTPDDLFTDGLRLIINGGTSSM